MISSYHSGYTYTTPPIKYFCENTQPESDEVFGILDYRKYMKRRIVLNDTMGMESEKSRTNHLFLQQRNSQKKNGGTCRLNEVREYNAETLSGFNF